MNEHSPKGAATPAVRGTSWKALVGTALIVLAIAAALWFWRTSRAASSGWSSGGPIDVAAVTVKAGPAPVSIDAVGELRAVRQVSVANEIPGRIREIGFESGQRANAGTPLIQLDDSTEQANLVAAKASAIFADQQLKRANELSAVGATSKELLQQRRAERDQAAAQVQQIETRIRKMRVRAPFSGELGLRKVDLGQYVNAGDPIVTLTDLSTLYVNFDVPQRQLDRLRIGQRVTVKADALDGAPQQAAIDAIEPQVSNDTRNATVQASLSNKTGVLRPGMYVSVAVALPPEPDALMVPATAVMTSASGNAAAVIRALTAGRTGKAEIVPITTGRRIGDEVVVLDGLKPGDVVITEGQLRVRPGAAVHIVDETANGPTGKTSSANATGG
ncbi:efflux transporter periplasmic adaptor subunit [Trinickia dabaoshanensis]|uniref:Efflux transporter periplasmic adaptor subunit n=1 Tax=Trinickia dabaoshanensis TaxID=564714 RepID=A0A2N7VWU9_9BURK|nr:efflux RND transporter periplasmic adaptor subunit [Trinickia dabaoshanensis]PMS21630.1 efflux transporter periplasmic adaptor subunit [Trinickia dabaoshanensis]